VNPRARRAALYAIGAIAMLASVNALAHSYAGLYDWAVHHLLSGWQAMSWPAEIDVFLAVGELALYVAYLDGWPARQRAWPWATALVGLAVSVAGNIGHIAARPGQPVILADRVTAATSPLAAFARPHRSPARGPAGDARGRPDLGTLRRHRDRAVMELTDRIFSSLPQDLPPRARASVSVATNWVSA
jgi:hypothetical protein